MEDGKIVDLYWERSEEAIKETMKKYGKYCYSIAYNILSNAEEADEAVNDTYLGAWNSIPPHRPTMLSTFLGKITRRISINKWDKNTAEKRGGGEIPLALNELSDCVPASGNVETEFEARRLAGLINSFVRSLPSIEQKVFVCRYWYLDPISVICSEFGFSQSKVKSMLSRTRTKLKNYLEKEDIFYAQ